MPMKKHNLRGGGNEADVKYLGRKKSASEASISVHCQLL